MSREIFLILREFVENAQRRPFCRFLRSAPDY
jgi:hypothetical protein